MTALILSKIPKNGKREPSPFPIGLLRYNTFEELFKDFNIEMLADNSMTKLELLNVLQEFYTPEKQRQYGVIGIRIEK